MSRLMSDVYKRQVVSDITDCKYISDNAIPISVDRINVLLDILFYHCLLYTSQQQFQVSQYLQ